MAQLNTTSFTGTNGLDSAASLATLGVGHTMGLLDGQDHRVSPGKYLVKVLNGTTPVDIVDHGIGPFEDKTVHFQPSGFGVVCILNVSRQDLPLRNTSSSYSTVLTLIY